MRLLSRLLPGLAGAAIAAAALTPLQVHANPSHNGAGRDVGYDIYKLQQRVGALEAELKSLRGEISRLSGNLNRTPSSSGAGTHPVSYQGNQNTQPPPPSGSGFYHRVERGDTLASISRRYKVGLDSLVAANQIVNPHALRIGQEILVPGASMPAPRPNSNTSSAPPANKPAPSNNSSAGYYTVRSGDTLFGIARNHGTSVDSIVSLNPSANPSALQIGQQLKVPGATGSHSSSSSNKQPSSPSGGNVHNGSANSGEMIEAPPGHGFYQVESGDNLHSIAVSFETTTKNLRNLNELNSDNIRVGQYLLVPVPDDSLYED
ncbi:MAG: LysM peptidoglycan-binding domain-containing protein [Verrucomicrobiota bacterium]